MNPNIATVINYGLAGGIGVGAATLAGKVAPDAIKPDSPGEEKAWMAAGGVGGAAVAMQVLPRVGKSQMQKTLATEAAFKLQTFTAVADHNLPKAGVAGAADQLYSNFHKSANALTTATASGTHSGLAGRLKFGGAAAIGAVAGVGLLAGGMAIADRFSD